MFSKIPNGYTLCSRTDCPCSDTCLRNVAYRNITPDVERITIFNPHILDVSQAPCSNFKEYRIVRNAYGFEGIYRQIPNENKKQFFLDIPGTLSESTYYRMKRGAHTISPSLQEEIIQAAISRGASTPLEFDAYKDEIDW